MMPATVPTIFSATVAIRSIVGHDLGGHGHLRDPQPGDLGDVHRQVTHPLEVGDHPQGRDEHPQVAGHRLLEGEELEGALLDPLPGGVDGGVVADDLLGDLGVRGEQGLGGPRHGDLDHLGHVDELVDDRVELVEVGIAHGGER